MPDYSSSKVEERLRAGGSPRHADVDSLWAQIQAAGPEGLPEPQHEDDWSYYGDSDEQRRRDFDRRRTFIAFYGYAVPTRDAVDGIARFVGRHRVVEVCAGNGLWARLLSASGVDIVASDASAPRGTPFYPIEVLDAAEAVRAHADRECLLLSWPPYKNSVGLRALEAFSGSQLVYIGDPRFTGDKEFQTLLASEWTLVNRLRLPSWPGIEDAVHLYLRGGKALHDLLSQRG